jgi:hypothetical protein
MKYIAVACVLALYEERRQLFIRTHNDTLSVAAMCVSNPDRSPRKIRMGGRLELHEEHTVRL